jgi:proteasome assembly chaperone (PAC2) family protein
MDDEIYDRIIFLADPDLNEPVLVIGLEGWIDAGIAASTAISTMLETIPTEVLATFDTEYFIDQRARRPLARIVDGITTELTWPEIQLRYGRDGDGADVLFLVGPEPDFHWSDFVDVVTDAAGRFDVRLVVGLGAFPAPTPHCSGEQRAPPNVRGIGLGRVGGARRHRDRPRTRVCRSRHGHHHALGASAPLRGFHALSPSGGRAH